jgi:hypothetical protein
MTEHPDLLPSPSNWKSVSEANPSLEDCAQTYLSEDSWTGFLWVLFRGKVVQGLATRNAEGTEVMPSMTDGYRYRDEVTHWHPMREPSPPVLGEAAQTDA